MSWTTWAQWIFLIFWIALMISGLIGQGVKVVSAISGAVAEGVARGKGSGHGE